MVREWESGEKIPIRMENRQRNVSIKTEGELTQLARSKGKGKYIEMPRGEGATRFKVQESGRELRLGAELDWRRVESAANKGSFASSGMMDPGQHHLLRWSLYQVLARPNGEAGISQMEGLDSQQTR